MFKKFKSRNEEDSFNYIGIQWDGENLNEIIRFYEGRDKELLYNQENKSILVKPDLDVICLNDWVVTVDTEDGNEEDDINIFTTEIFVKKYQDITPKVTLGNAYEIMQQSLSQLEPIDIKNLMGTQATNCAAVIDLSDNLYFMLLNNEKRYYTVLHRENEEVEGVKLVKEAFECLMELGDIVEIQVGDDYNYAEVWVKDPLDGLAHVYYLFPYDLGVVEVK